MPIGVYAQSAVMYNTTILMCGDWSTTSELRCYTYTPAKDVCTVAASLKVARWEHGMIVYKGVY
jgi:hypothetical protein